MQNYNIGEKVEVSITGISYTRTKEGETKETAIMRLVGSIFKAEKTINEDMEAGIRMHLNITSEDDVLKGEAAAKPEPPKKAVKAAGKS